MQMDETATLSAFQQSRTVHVKRKFNGEEKVAEMEVEVEAENGNERMDEEDEGRRTRRRRDDNQVEVSQETQNMDDVSTRDSCCTVRPSLFIHFFLIILCVLFPCLHSFIPNFFHKYMHSHTHTYTHIHTHTYTHTHIGGGRPRDHRNRSCDTRLRELQSSVQDSDMQVVLPSNQSIYATPCISYSILFYPILSYSILFYSILFYSILFHSSLSYPILSYPILSNMILKFTCDINNT